jgi:hypothetical protein
MKWWNHPCKRYPHEWNNIAGINPMRAAWIWWQRLSRFIILTEWISRNCATVFSIFSLVSLQSRPETLHNLSGIITTWLPKTGHMQVGKESFAFLFETVRKTIIVRSQCSSKNLCTFGFIFTRFSETTIHHVHMKKTSHLENYRHCQCLNIREDQSCKVRESRVQQVCSKMNAWALFACSWSIATCDWVHGHMWIYSPSLLKRITG